MSQQTDLFPPSEPYGHGVLDVGDGHRIYWQQSGNPNGVPALFLHGGPGAGASPVHRRFFDPTHYRIIAFDQRGAGRSRPEAGVENNTTAHLIADMERLRRLLMVDKWLLFGGSWGATLALAYGLKHPEQCLGFILRGVFLARKRELDWFLNGIGTVFPEARRAFLQHLGEEERADPLRAYHRRLMSDDARLHRPAALAWNAYENACSVLIPKETAPCGPPSLALARIEAHYFINGMFFDDGIPLSKIGALRSIPCAVVQGRYDIVCPITTADALVRAWPEIDYKIVPDAGHSALEPGIRRGLVAATERFKGVGGADH